MERDYFDARFDGLEKLMTSQQANLREYIVSVSTNVHRLEGDLHAHKATCPPSIAVARVDAELEEHMENIDAHGRKATDKFAGNLIAWIALAIAAIGALLDFRKHP